MTINQALYILKHISRGIINYSLACKRPSIKYVWRWQDSEDSERILQDIEDSQKPKFIEGQKQILRFH